jgi:hypothetical protein
MLPLSSWGLAATTSLAAALMPSTARANVGELYRQCTELGKAEHVAGGRVTLPNIPAAICFGYFPGVQDMLRAYNAETQKPFLMFICLPDGTSATQLAAIFTSYVGQRPETWHMSPGHVVLEPLRTAFPCKD